MKRAIGWGFGVMIGSGLAVFPASAQSLAPTRAEAVPADAVAPQPAPEKSEPRAAGRLLRDIGGDYVHFFSIETAVWVGVGGGAALAVHPADDRLRDETQGADGPSTDLRGGQQYGGVAVQIPLALGWWIVGHATGSTRAADAGRDLLRGQVSAVSWTYVLKYPINRTRPNGDPRSFPSGHASSTFATAIVLQDYYGWKLGVPAFLAASYTAASRVTDNKHWASDVVFGAFLGMASGRTVTLHMRGARVSFAPQIVPGGGAVLVTASR